MDSTYGLFIGIGIGYLLGKIFEKPIYLNRFLDVLIFTLIGWLLCSIYEFSISPPKSIFFSTDEKLGAALGKSLAANFFTFLAMAITFLLTAKRKAKKKVNNILDEPDPNESSI